MEPIIVLGIVTTLLLWPFVTGVVAISFGRNFWWWFAAGFFLPFISLVLLFILSSKEKEYEPNLNSIQKSNEIKFKKATEEVAY